jgi:hypothetical protein
VHRHRVLLPPVRLVRVQLALFRSGARRRLEDSVLVKVLVAVKVRGKGSVPRRVQAAFTRLQVVQLLREVASTLVSMVVEGEVTQLNPAAASSRKTDILRQR